MTLSISKAVAPQRCSGIQSAAAAIVLILTSSRVSGVAVPGSHIEVRPQFQIQADGGVGHHTLSQVNLQHTDHMQKLMRAEIGAFHTDAVGSLAEAASQTGRQEVNCSAKDLDPIHNNFCAILDGSNWQIAGKLERTVKKMHSLAMGVGKDMEQDSLMETLQASLWELWFCAKRIAPKCNPQNTTEDKYKVARENAWSALVELQTRAGVTPTTTTAPRVGIPAAVNLELSANASPVKANARVRRLPHHLNLSMTVAALLHTDNFTEAANVWLDRLTTEPKVPDKLMQAITDACREAHIKEGQVQITDDSEGNIKKFKDNLMTLHECASMPQCPAPTCCDPAHPKQEKFLEARDQALEAWCNLDEDIRLENKEALDMLKTIAHTTTYYPIGHPLHYPTPQPVVYSDTVQKIENVSSGPTYVQEDGGSKVLLIAICVSSGVVVLAVLALVAMGMGAATGKKKAGGGGGAEAQDWGEEGYGEEEY